MKTNWSTSAWPIRILSVAVSITMLALCVRAQSKNEQVFDAVPEALRARLLERLDLYVQYQRTKDYEKLFDLYSETTLAKVFHGQSKADFVKAYQSGDAQGSSSRLIEFVPAHTEKIAAEGAAELFVIYGKARSCEGGKVIEKKRVAIEAQQQDGDWYFSPIADVLID